MLLCNGCKQFLPEDAFALDKKRASGRRYKCRACSAAEFKRWRDTDGYARRLAGQKHKRQALKATDPKRRWADMALNNAKRRAVAAGLPFTLTRDWAEQNAPDVCPALGFMLNYANSASLKDSPTIDRIDNTRGYEPDNCWVISMLANRIKSDATVAQIEALASALRARLDNCGENKLQATGLAQRAA